MKKHLKTRLTLAKALDKTTLSLRSWSLGVYKPPLTKREIELRRWYLNKGDRDLRLNYALTENSVVFDIGSYEGEWASHIFSMYQPTIYAFEPVGKYADFIKKRFKNNKKIKIFQFGLGDRTEKLKISLEENESSTYKANENYEQIRIRPINQVITELGISQIDLMKINIEGGEYDLLDNLIKHDLIKIIVDIQIQFHDFVPSAERRMKIIQKELSKTHKLSYKYPFVWENWRRK